MKFAPIAKKLLEKDIPTFHGGTDISNTRARILYFTPSEEYADVFKVNFIEKYGKQGILLKCNIDDSNFLDLRKYGHESNISPYQFCEILLENEIDLPTPVIEFFQRHGRASRKSEYYIFSFIHPTYDLADIVWDYISKKYNGCILEEINPEVASIGAVDSYAIDKKYHKNVIHNIKKIQK